MLRLGRFDFILPIGSPDPQARKQIFKKFFEPLNLDEVGLDAIAEKAKNYTPADIQAICLDIAQFTFEQELLSGKEYKARTGFSQTYGVLLIYYIRKGHRAVQEGRRRFLQSGLLSHTF